MIKVIITLFLFLDVATAQVTGTEAEQSVSFLSYFSSQIVGRPLNSQELNQLKVSGPQAFAPIANAWFNEPAFLDSAQVFTETLVRTSGAADGVDFNLPGYLGKDIARRKRPYADIITATSCVDASGQSVTCDTQAPFAAGVLTTKAFLSTFKGAYNISRAGKVIKNFLCTTYPLADTEEPKITVNELIPQFATTNGSISFGNGNNCYSCHSQFGLHTQFFVRFDLKGVYQTTATGVQNPAATDGFSLNGLATSHFKDAARAGQEQSRMLGQPAANLADAARVIAQSPRFLPCAVQNLMQHYMRLTDQDMATLKPDLYVEIASQARKLQAQPSLSHLLSATITNPHVFKSFQKSGARP